MGPASRKSEDTELQHPATICGGSIAISVTGPGIHDKLIALKFAVLIFGVRHSDCSANGATRVNDLMQMVVTLEVARKRR
jgi:hypothetical protein